MNLAGVDLGIHKVALASFVDEAFNTTIWQSASDSRAMQLHELAMAVRDTITLWHVDTV